MRVCKVSFLLYVLSGEIFRGLSAHVEVFSPSYKCYLSFQSSCFFSRTSFGQPFQYLFNKRSSLKLPLLQEQFWENRWLCTLLKIPANGMCRYHTMMLKWGLQIVERQNQQPPGLQGKPCLWEDSKDILVLFCYFFFFFCIFFYSFQSYL